MNNAVDFYAELVL